MKLIIVLFIPFLLCAITLKEIDSMPTSLAKDFYIWVYLQQDITQTQAKKAYAQLQNKNRTKVVNSYLKKADDKEVAFEKRCRSFSIKKLAKQKSECIDLGFSVYKATKAKPLELVQIFNKSNDTTHKQIAQLMSLPNLYETAIKQPKQFCTIFNGCGSSYRQKVFNKNPTKGQIRELAQEKSFSKSIELAVLDPKLKHFQKALLFDFDSQNLSAKANFYLAINAIKHQKTKLAPKYLQPAYEKFYYRFDKDRALFWLYLVTKEQSYLKKVAQSFDLNLFSIYANELLGKEIKEYETVTDLAKDENSYDNTDPINWFHTLQRIKQSSKKELFALAKEFKSQKTLGEYAFILERAHKYKKHYFPMPQKNELLERLPKEEVALLYAVIRQESRFIPGSISHSFALGKTQVMPFLVKDIAKQRNEKIALSDMFKPRVAITYGIHQLNYLQKHLYHPLLVAYGYNGGIGFTKRKVLQSGLFKSTDRFQPWLSMELVPYSESRRYGQKVLANYFIYLDALGKQKKIQDLITALKNGSKIARW